MLRTYLPGDRRLHIWNSKYRITNRPHTHPWGFTSTVLRGWIRDKVYTRDVGEPTHLEYTVRCGEDAHLLSAPQEIKLRLMSDIIYNEGDSYIHLPDHIHETESGDGSVTIITRNIPNYGIDNAQTFVPYNQPWISVASRPSTPEEIQFAEDSIIGLEF